LRGPLLRRSQEVHMPVSSSLSSAFPKLRVGRLPATIREHDFSRGCFRSCRHSIMFRPLCLLTSQTSETSACFHGERYNSPLFPETRRLATVTHSFVSRCSNTRSLVQRESYRSPLRTISEYSL
jgi:hypothetical protein